MLLAKIRYSQIWHQIPILVVYPITAFGSPAFVPFNQFRKVTRLFRHPDKLVLQQLPSGRTLCVIE